MNNSGGRNQRGNSGRGRRGFLTDNRGERGFKRSNEASVNWGAVDMGNDARTVANLGATAAADAYREAAEAASRGLLVNEGGGYQGSEVNKKVIQLGQVGREGFAAGQVERGMIDNEVEQEIREVGEDLDGNGDVSLVEDREVRDAIAELSGRQERLPETAKTVVE